MVFREQGAMAAGFWEFKTWQVYRATWLSLVAAAKDCRSFVAWEILLRNRPELAAACHAYGPIRLLLEFYCWAHIVQSY